MRRGRFRRETGWQVRFSGLTVMTMNQNHSGRPPLAGKSEAASVPAWASPDRPADGAPWVLELAAVASSERRLVGGKAAHLATLTRARFVVPPGCCVTTAAFDAFLAACPQRHELYTTLTRLAAGPRDEVAQLARHAAVWLAKSPIPPEIEVAVLDAWRRLGEDRVYAVRSSATVEDAGTHSFAGQFESFLNVRGDSGLLEAIRKCWLSLFTERALAYHLRNGLPPSATAMAVVVQEMVAADHAGVMFTVDPATGSASRIVIEAVPGTGEKLVAGQLNPERLVLSKATCGIVERQSPDPDQQLAEKVVRRLGTLACEVEGLFGGPQDIEWAVRGDQVFLLQARPVTVRTSRAAAVVQQNATDPDASSAVWTTANAIEALPDVVTPLSWSLMQILLHDFLDPLMRRLGLTAEPQLLIELIAGRAYLNMGLLRRLLRRLGPLEVDVAAVLGGRYDGPFGTSATDTSTRSRLVNLRNIGRALRLGLWMVPGLIGQRRLIARWGQRVLDDAAHIQLSQLTDEQLADVPAALLRAACRGEGERTWAAAAWMGACAVGGSTAVFRLARRWLNDHDGSIANRLLACAGPMHSAENGLALARLAAWVEERPALAQTVRAAGSFSELQRRLTEVDAGRAFLERWQTFLHNHGHQARGGMDPAQPRWSESPDLVLDVLRSCLQLPEGTDLLTLHAQRVRERNQLLAECRRRLRNPLKRTVFFVLLHVSQRGLVQRENVKNDGVCLVAIVRRALLEAGHRLAARGGLREPGEVFFLNLEELRAALCGEGTFDIRATITDRQAEDARLRRLNPPPVVVGCYDETAPSASGVDRNARTFNGVAVSPGVVIGRARVILQADAGACVLPGEVLVAPYTDPGWTPYFLTAVGIVVDIGGLLSHGSVVAREYGLPAVVNVGPATQIICTGDRIQVDGNVGRVTILERAGTQP
jgi:pyruvate,water dikinase